MNRRKTIDPPKLAGLIVAIPPARRGAVMQAVAAFDPSATVDDSFEIGPIRAAFAEYWEDRFQMAVPIQALRAVLQPPVPIRTVLVFSKLILVRHATEAAETLSELADYLHRRANELSSSSQLELFAIESPTIQATRDGRPGESVSSLEYLIDEKRKFPTVYADPPWAYDNSASRGAAANHYPTMTVDDICAEPVEQLAANDAHLHLWTTNAFLREAFDVVDAWGFQFKSCLIWAKSDIGMGNYWRVSHEFLLLGVRGKLTFRNRAIRSWIQAPRTAHSRKPGIVRTLVEKVSPGPYLELYGREELPNSQWTVYGNQIERRLF